MKKIIFMALMEILCLLVISAFGSQQDADTVARNFLIFRHSPKTLTGLTPLMMKNSAGGAGQLYGYLAELSAGGYLLISESKNVLPIKAYSLHNNFIDLPPPYQEFLLEEMQALFSTTLPLRLPQVLGEATKAWSFLLGSGRLPQSYVANTFLLSTTWMQSYPYNKFLPKIAGKNVLVGCVNIAIGQIMNYHQWPAVGKGVVYSDLNGQELRTILYHPLDYGNMPASLISASVSSLEVDETARMLADLAIANKTDLGLVNSGTFFDPSVLIDRYGYAPTVQSLASNNGLFFTTIQSEIDQSRPVLISIPGHMGVVDGYVVDGTGKSMHLNLGWGGIDDDFYFIDQNITAGNIIFPPPFSIYYGITPCQVPACSSVILETNDTLTSTGVSGVFDYADDVDWYEVYLRGNVTLSGDRGYSSQAFYISLYDNDGRLLLASDSSMSTTSPLVDDRYFVRASLGDKIGSTYDYSADSFAHYTISLTGERLTAEERQAMETGHPPEFAVSLPETLVLGNNRLQPYQVQVDVRDPDNDPFLFSVLNSNPHAVDVTLVDRILSIIPLQSGTASRITVTATANNENVARIINVLVGDNNVAVGPCFDINGTFASGDSVDSFAVLLDGNCTISGDRGYSNQAFYTGIKQGSFQVVDDGNQTISDFFPANLYTITASLRSGMSYYPYTQGQNDSYTLNGSCSEYSISIAKLAALLQISLDGLATKADLTLVDLMTIVKILAGQDGGSLSDLPSLDLNGNALLDLGDVILLCRQLSGL